MPWMGFITSRLLVLVAGIFGAEALTANRGQAITYDLPRLTHPFGGALGDVFGPLARWDAVWYMLIAHHGYDGPTGVPAALAGDQAWSGSAAFFPLYPLALKVGSGFAASPGALVVASTVISLIAFAGAARVLYGLALLDLGAPAASATIWLIALFPGSLFFSAPYSKSLFLLLSVASFWFARQGRWALAGAVGALASATRPVGVLLVVPLALLYLYGPRGDGDGDGDEGAGGSRLRPRFPVRADAAWLLLVPCGLAAYGGYLAATTGDFLAFAHAQANWFSSPGSPFAGAWHAVEAAVTSAGDLAGDEPSAAATRLDWLNFVLLPFFALAVAGVVGLFRRMPPAYGSYALLSVLAALSARPSFEPLESFPRFMAVCFPLFMWLGALLAPRRALLTAVAAAFAVLLTIATAEFVAWEWIGA